MAESLRDESMSPSPEHQSGLPSLTHHCILHAVEGIAPHGINTVSEGGGGGGGGGGGVRGEREKGGREVETKGSEGRE